MERGAEGKKVDNVLFYLTLFLFFGSSTVKTVVYFNDDSRCLQLVHSRFSKEVDMDNVGYFSAVNPRVSARPCVRGLVWHRALRSGDVIVCRWYGLYAPCLVRLPGGLVVPGYRHDPYAAYVEVAYCRNAD